MKRRKDNPLGRIQRYAASIATIGALFFAFHMNNTAIAQPGPGPGQGRGPFGGPPDRPPRQEGNYSQHVPLTNRVTITIEGDYRVISANGVPDHTPGQFPNRGNPNSISPQNYNFRVPLKPQIADKPTPFALGIFGIALNGVVFDPGANEWWNNDRESGWQYEPLTSGMTLGIDQYNAHVQPTGAYHYHALPVGMLAKIKNAREHMTLIGWAADGFPIYAPWGYSDPKNASSALKTLKSSYKLKQGERPGGPGGKYDGKFVRDFEYVASSGDLDECNGRFGVTPEFPQGTYHYFVTAEFPFIPRMFKGVPDRSFLRRGPPPGMRGGPPGRDFGRPR